MTGYAVVEVLFVDLVEATSGKHYETSPTCSVNK